MMPCTIVLTPTPPPVDWQSSFYSPPYTLLVTCDSHLRPPLHTRTHTVHIPPHSPPIPPPPFTGDK